MKATLEYDISKERCEFIDAVNGQQLADCVRAFSEWLKDNEVESDVLAAYAKCFEGFLQ